MNDYKYELIDDPDEITQIIDIAYSPFNLKKDLKNIRDGVRQRMRLDIVNEVIQGPGRASCAMICGQDKKDVCILKIRIACDNRGKSGGIRAYCLVIKNYRKILLLGVTSHQRGQNDLTDSAKKMLRELCELVAEDIEKVRENND